MIYQNDNGGNNRGNLRISKKQVKIIPEEKNQDSMDFEDFSYSHIFDDEHDEIIS